MRYVLAFLVFATLVGPGALARSPSAALPAPYVVNAPVAGTITIAGHGSYGDRADFIETLTRSWEEAFQRLQPQVRFTTKLQGTAAAMGGLYTGSADIALMGREIWPPEIAAFREVFGYDPTGINVMTGSFATRNRGYAITIFVNRANPIEAISLKQLDAAFSVARRRGGKPIVYWGDLGLRGAWAHRPVHLYGLPIARGFAEFFEEKVFLGSQIWNPSLREFADAKGSTGEEDGGAAMVKAMSQDPDALGYAGALYHDPGVKLLAVADRGKPVFPSVHSVTDRSYPLDRVITAYVNKPPRGAVRPAVREFLRFILSQQGQEIVRREGGGYLPILAPQAAEQLKKLEP